MTMVIKATTALSGGTQSAVHLWPIGNCIFSEDATYTGDGYRINSTTYIAGGNAAPLAGVDPAQSHVLMTPVLGYIGKSGRFVGMSVEH